ncbi:branched-chain amino acid ABC transporter permease, partial [Rhizobiaceae sp. 2RAB30]
MTTVTAAIPLPVAPGRTPWRNEAVGFTIGFLLLALLPFVFTDTYSRHVLIMIFTYAIVASNWDLSLGYGGVFNFGHLALFGIGVYAYSLQTKLAGNDPSNAILATRFIAT